MSVSKGKIFNQLAFFSQSVALVAMVMSPVVSHAGAYIFANDTGSLNYVTHPQGYTGAGGVITVRVCIDPASANAADMEYSIQNNIAVFNQLQPTTGNIVRNSNNNIPSGALDFESVSLHEIGHCLGMAHVNLASESQLTGNNRDYTRSTTGAGVSTDPNNGYDLDAGADGIIGSSDDIRGDDENLVYFRRSNNNPFTIDSVVDSTTYSRNLADLPAGHSYAANADRDVAADLGYPLTEAVMQQGTLYDEAQRTLGHDDVATLKYAQSGKDELASGSSDNYTMVMEYGGISNTNCDINVSFTNTSSLAFCSIGGTFIGTNHLRITTANIEFGQSYNWFFNAPVNPAAPVLDAIGAQSLVEGDTLVITVSATDADVGDSLSFTTTGLPAFAGFVDNADGTATLTLSPAIGDAVSTSMTVTVSDDGTPVKTDNESFTIDVAVLDTDGDGLSDYDEINVYLTLPDNPDTDGDFFADGVEVAAGSDPLLDTSWPLIADGDVAPLGASNGILDVADLLIIQRIVNGQLTPTPLEFAHGDVFPVGTPDGVIDISDMLLIRQMIDAAQ